MTEFVDGHGEDDDGAGGNFLDAGLEAELGAAVSEDGHDERADERAEDAALAAVEARAADDDGGDDVEFHAHGGGRIALADVGELEDACDAGEGGADDVDEDFHAVDGDAAEAGGLFVG